MIIDREAIHTELFGESVTMNRTGFIGELIGERRHECLVVLTAIERLLMLDGET
jgi:hypothetical protein